MDVSLTFRLYLCSHLTLEDPFPYVSPSDRLSSRTPFTGVLMGEHLGFDESEHDLLSGQQLRAVLEVKPDKLI